MQTVKVIDPRNLAFDFVASKATEDDIILTMQALSKYRMRKTLLRYGKRNIFVDTPYRYFSAKLKTSYLSFFKLTELIYKKHWFNSIENIDKKYYISMLTKMYLTQKAHMIEDDSEFFQKFNFWDYINMEEYQKFKNHLKELNVIDCFDITEHAISIDFNRTVKNIYILHSEDISPLVMKAINKCFKYEKLYFIGDDYKVHSLYAIADSNNNSDSIIDLSKLASLPTGYLRVYNKINKNLKLPYTFQFVNSDAKITVRKLTDALMELKGNSQQNMVIVYDFPLLAYNIEPVLFKENIPFSGIMDEYKFPKNLFIVYRTMVNLLNKTEPLTVDEIKILIKSIRPEITDKFGGVNQLLKKFNLPVMSSAVLSKFSFSTYLIKAWVDRNFVSVLRPELSLQWNKWLHKFSEKWLSPDIICNTVIATKGLDFDITVYIRHSRDYDSSLYTTLMNTKKKLILTSI